MGMTIVLTVVQFVITMLFFPIRIGAKGHASLARDRAELDLTVFRLPIARVRIKREKGIFNLYVNGDKTEMKGRLKLKRAIRMLKQCKIEDISINGNLLALVGTDDAKNTALMSASIIGVLQPLFSTLNVYTAQGTEALELDGKVRVELSLLQLGGLIAAGLRG